MSNKDYTVILINENRAIRADLSRKGLTSTSDFISQNLSSDSSFVENVESVLADKPIGRKTLILTTRIWSQVVLLPRLAVDGLTDDELKNALKFEVETLSGVDAELSLVGYKLLRETSENFHYWVSVCTAFEFAQTVSLLESRGCRSVFVGHPAGMSSRTQIEFWPGLTCYRHGEEVSAIQFCHANLDSHRWIEDFELAGEAIKKGNYVVSKHEQIASLTKFGVDSANVLDLESDADLAFWFSDVVNVVEQRKQTPPLIKKSKPASIPKTRILLKVALAMIAMAACYLHWNWIKQQETKIANEIESYQKPLAEKKLYDSEIFKTIKTRNDLEQEAEKIRMDSRKVQFLLESQTDRIACLLQILRNLHTNDIMINEIAQDENGMYVAGISLSSETAPLLANRMRELARPKGWQVTPATQKGKKEMVNGGPWDFKIRLTDNGPIQSGITAQSLDTLPVNKKHP